MREREPIDDVRAEGRPNLSRRPHAGLSPREEADLSDRSEVLKSAKRSLNTLTLFVIGVTLSGLFTLWLSRGLSSDDHTHAMTQEERPPLTLWHSERGDDKERLVRLVQRYATRARKAVKLQFFPAQELSAQLLASEPSARPDLWISTHERLGAWVERDLVAPLGLKVNKPLEMVGGSPMLFTSLTYRGELYGLPLSYDALALFYRRMPMGNLLGVHNFQSLLRRLREVGSRLPQLEGLLGVADLSDPILHAPWLHGFGGDAYALSHDEDAQEALLKSVTRVKALRGYEMMTSALSGERAVQLFLEGKTLALLHRLSFVKSLKGDDNMWGWAPLPRMIERPDGPHRWMKSYLIVKGVMISKHSPHVEAAWHLAYLLNAESDTLFWWRKALSYYRYNEAYNAHNTAEVSNDPQHAHVLGALKGFLSATLERDEPPAEALKRLLEELRAPQEGTHSASASLTSPSLTKQGALR